MSEQLYYICDMRREWLKKPYVSFWRHEDAGYCYPLSWAGKYAMERVASQRNYYWSRNTKAFTRFPVPCLIVDQIGIEPIPKTIDGDAGPVVLMNKAVRAFLRASMLDLPDPAETSGERL